MRAALLYSSAIPSFGVKEPAIALRIAKTWLAFGCFAVLCVPALRGRSEWLGWMPLWLIVVPAAQLLILRWRALFATTRGMLRRLHHRRAQPALSRTHSARKRAHSPRVARRGQALLAAFLFR